MREFIISASDNLVKKIVKDKTNDLTHLFYVYYKKGHAKYLIVSRDIAKSGFYFLVLLWLALGLTGLNIDLFQDLFGKQRLADSSYCSEIYDNPDYFSAEEEKALRRIFCDIQKKTGISVVLENFTYQEWVFFRYSDLSDWIHKRYDALFSDEDHWLLVLSAGNPDNDSKWFIREIHGDNTEDVLTPYVIEKFTSELQDKLNHASESEDYSIGNVVCASFYEFYKRELSGGPVDIGATAFWVFVLILAITLYGILLFFLYINLKYIFVKYIFKTRLFQIGYTLFKKETICPVCCGSYVINIHSECPHCGVKIKRAPYGTSCHSDKNINASSPVFDNIGSYGGDQLDIYRQAGRYFFDCVFSYNKELFETARSYPKFKDYTNREISDLFRSISIEGCGYVAVVNAIFVHFKNDNKRFEKLFGFSMIGTDGDYNFNRLFLDFHVNTDNKIFLDYPYGIEHLMRSTYSYYKRFKNAFAIKFGTPIFDEKNKNAFSLKAAQAVLDTYENDSVVTLDAERGVNPFSLSNRLLYYLDQHGITATVEHKENLYIYEVNQQLTDNKTIIISAHGYSLYYTEEDLEKQNPAFLNGRGHAMVIVGTTNKDNCIVSSWGNMYYLHLSDVYKKEFLIVDIKS